ncbi:TetR/AcrR family transcriptional regulator, partial [Chloroflexota bacterium]
PAIITVTIDGAGLMVTHTIRRKLSPAQLERRDRILTATREIISNEGSNALNMQDVAKKAGVSRVTLYRYYSSREHLINDMALAWGLSLIDRLQRATPPGNTVGEKLTAVFASIFEEAHQHPNLIAVTLNSLISPDYASVESHVDVEQLLPSLLNMVIAEAEVHDAEYVLGALSRLTLANLLYINSGRSDTEEAVSYSAHVARLLYGDELWNRQEADTDT